MDEKIVKILIKEVQKKSFSNEVPVAAIITRNNKIIAKARNCREKKKLTTEHAEIIAIKKANRKLKDWRLTDCEIYITLKPCEMCAAVIKEARIKKAYYLLDNLDFKKGFDKISTVRMDIKYDKYRNEYSKILSDFFSNMR